MIDIIRFGVHQENGRDVESICGIRVTDKGGIPQIHLFEISENPGVPVNNNLLPACLAIRDQIAPGMALSEIDWRLSQSFCEGDFSFKEVGGLVTRIDFNAKFFFGKYFNANAEQYEAALNKPSVQTINHHGVADKVFSQYPVFLPSHPQGYMLFKEYYDAPHMKGEFEVVIADSRKFLSAWKESAIGEDKALFKSSIPQSLSYIYGHSAEEAPAMAHVAFGNGMLSFINGRHRTFNAINAGAPFVPVEISTRDNVVDFKKQVEWKPEGKSARMPSLPVYAAVLE